MSHLTPGAVEEVRREEEEPKAGYIRPPVLIRKREEAGPLPESQALRDHS